MDKRNRFILHSLVARHSPMAIDADIARTIGFDGLEASGAKIKACLDAGLSTDEVKALVGDLDVPGAGFLLDVERHAAGSGLVADARALCELAVVAGARAIQAITGPIPLAALGPDAATTHPGLYRGVVGLPVEEQVRLTAAGLASVADVAAERGLLVYFEALSWTPLNTIDRQIEVIERADRDNVRLVIDFWHCYTSGDTPERIARIDKDLLFGVHICDSRSFDGGIPDEPVLRDVATGAGVLNLREWVDAVKATGYDDWWSCELFCRRQHQENSYDVAASLKTLMHDLVLGAPG